MVALACALTACGTPSPAPASGLPDRLPPSLAAANVCVRIPAERDWANALFPHNRAGAEPGQYRG